MNLFRSRTPEITVHELKVRLDAGEDFILLDVREPREYEIANLGGTLIPLGQLANRLEELADYKNKSIVVHCRSGARSANAVSFMRAQGFNEAVNLKGGTLAWSREIDPSLPTY